ncbi:MAG: MFS transporter [Promethearchaeota archaeon]
MNTNESERASSKISMISYGLGRCARQFVANAFIAFGFYFYETEVGLNVVLTSLAFILYGVWNAVNDPLIGVLTNKTSKLNKKFGRFFPWLLFGGIPWIFCYLLIFTPPNTNPKENPWVIFGWLILSTFLFDTFASIFDVNFYAFFPNKFRSVKERRIASGISVPMGIIGIIFGGIIPPMFVTYGVRQSYIIQAGAVIIIALILLGIALPGFRDDPVMKTIFYSKEKKKEEGESVFQAFKSALRQKSFITFLLMYMLFISLTICIQTSVPYIVRFILNMPASIQVFLQIPFLLGAILSIPLWIKLAQKLNDNKKTLILASVILTIFTFPFIFINTLLGYFIVLIFWGIGLGGCYVILPPVMGDVIDESIARHEKHEEGVYYGLRQFFSRLAIVIQSITFAIIHTMTGFKEGSIEQTANAVWGIHLQVGLAPGIYMLIAVLLFWKWYDLTPQKIEKNKIKIKELGL